MFLKKLKLLLSDELITDSKYIFFIILISTFLEIIGISLIIPIISFIFENERATNFQNSLNFIFGKNQSDEFILVILIISCLTVYLFKSLFLTYGSYKESKFIWRVKKYLSEKIIYNFINDKKKFYYRENSSKITNVLINEISFLVHLLMNVVIFLSEITIITSIGIILLIIEPRVFLSIFIISVFFLFLFNLITKKNINDLSKKRLITDIAYVKKSSQIIQGLREIIIYGKKNYFTDDFSKNNLKIFEANWKLEVLQKIPRYWLEYFIIVFAILVLFYLTKINYKSSDILVIMSLIVIFASRILPSAAKSFKAFQQIKIYKPSLNIIFSEIKKIKNTVNESKILDSELKFKNKISFKNISFSYKDHPVFKNMNFSIEKNSMIGIYGPNGSGKSTMLDILFGFLTPSKGKILIDGKNILDNYSLKSWQNIISYIPQNSYLIDSSVLENITFNKKIISPKKLKKAVKLSGLKKVLQSLPKGLKTEVGERGSRLSGGQIQRIALARAIYNTPKILVMDESLNSIDAKSSQMIISDVKKLKGITRIIVSHDIQVLRNCEKTFMLTNNSIKKLDI